MTFSQAGSPYKNEIYVNDSLCYVTDDNIVFENCTFRNCRILETIDIFRGLSNLTFKNCIFKKTDIAIHCKNSDFSTCIMRDSVLTDCRTIEDSSNKFPEPQPICPKEGQFIAYKLLNLMPNPNYKEFMSFYQRLSLADRLRDYPFIIGTLEIPASSPRVNSYGSKCRSAAATLIDAKPIFYDEDKDIKNAWDNLKGLCNNPDVFNALYHYGSPLFRNNPIEYEMGKTICADRYDSSHLYDCAGGIHFYMFKEEVEKLGYEIFKNREKQINSSVYFGSDFLRPTFNYFETFRKQIAYDLELLANYVKAAFNLGKEELNDKDINIYSNNIIDSSN